MHILGIDPGIRVTGWGVVFYDGKKCSYIDSGRICPPRNDSLSSRLGFLYRGLQQVIQKFNPQEAAVEEVFINMNAQGSLKLSHARGALLACVAEFSLETFEYAARVIKQSVVGTGTANKSQVTTMVHFLLSYTGVLSEDSADALAIAICHANHRMTPMYS